MPDHNGIEWEVVGLWSKDDGVTYPDRDDDGDIIPFKDADLEGADQIRIEFELPNGDKDYVTIHNDMDYGWDELEDYVDDYIDESSYFES